MSDCKGAIMRWLTRSKNIDHKGRAKAAYNKKNYHEAEKHLKILLLENMNDKWALDVFSRLLMNTGRHNEAVDHLLRLEANTEVEKAHWNRLLRSSNNARRWNVFRDCLNRIPVFDDLTYELIDRAFRINDDDTWRLQIIQKLKDTDSTWASLKSLDLLIVSGNTVAACEEIAALNKLGVPVAVTSIKMVKVLIELKDLDGARLLANSILEEEISEKNKEEVSDIIAIIERKRFKTGHIELALEGVNSALVIWPFHSKLHELASRIHWDLADVERVIEHASKALDADTNNSNAQSLFLKGLVKLGDIDRLIIEVDSAIASHPKRYNQHRIGIDIAFYERFDFADVVQRCDAALKQRPGITRFQIQKALAIAELGELERAQTVATNTLIEAPDDIDAILCLSQIKRIRGDGAGQISAINDILRSKGLTPFSSTDSMNHSITIEHLNCIQENVYRDGPLISVIMTTWGRDKLLDIAIKSILNQTHHNLELIIMDDRSEDDCFQYLQSLAEDDSRIRPYQVEENGGTYLAKNQGLTLANGEFITFMDSDDWCHPQRLQRQVETLLTQKDAVSTIHDYFRIESDSSIPFRNGIAVRMACISLMIRAEVHQKIGFFDCLRVGADSEYIERIIAVYGENSLVREKIPSMFMTQHTASLTGGGKFHISWRSITGNRFFNRGSWMNWHRKVANGESIGYLAHPQRVREFEAPVAMLASNIHWKPETALFSERIQSRNHQWWTGKKQIEAKHLSAKTAGRIYVEKLGIKLPDLYWSGTEISEIPELDDLPKRVVIKPDKGWNANNVWCLIDKVNILDGKEYTTDDIKNILSEDEFVQSQKVVFMAEEFLAPEIEVGNPVPRDYKFYCFGSKIAMLHVVDRVSVKDTSLNTLHYFDENFKPIKRRVMKNISPPAYELELPECFDEMVEAVKKIGSTLGIYMRIDMYATTKGAVFGEFTPTPHGGKGYSEWADKYLGSFWKGEEGCEDG